MENNRPLTPLQYQMQLRGVSMRELAGLSGESTALICYIARGLARFPTYEQLERCTRYMGCMPSDVYTKQQLRMMYPEQFPKRKRLNDGNPRVRIDGHVIDFIRRKGLDVNMVVNQSILAHLYSHGVKYGDIFGGSNDTERA